MCKVPICDNAPRSKKLCGPCTRAGVVVYTGHTLDDTFAEWRPTTFEGYEVNDLGSVRNSTRNTLLRPYKASGYMMVRLTRAHRVLVHRLVAESFCPRPSEEANEVHHIDSDPCNNAAGNLVWVTHQENIRYRHKK